MYELVHHTYISTNLTSTCRYPTTYLEAHRALVQLLEVEQPVGADGDLPRARVDLEGRDVGLGLDRGDLVDVQLRLAVRGVGVGVAGVGRVVMVMVVVPAPVAAYVMVPTSTRGYICKHKRIYM